jgi:RNA polymerase sigma-54 factor
MLDEVRALDPKPGLAFETTAVLAIRPDVLVTPDGRGGWRVELSGDALPRLLVNRRYHAMVKRQARTRADKSYLRERLSAANWLVRTLDQRADTILRIATEIVGRQTAFFEHGVERLAPLVLRDVAAALDVHESTVSRATANKYMATPRGTLAMRFFFTSGLATVDGAPKAVSSAVARHHIMAAVEGENADDILSDDRLVGHLRGKGIDIARRTVAKYRGAMHIPSSTVRRRMKSPVR